MHYLVTFHHPDKPADKLTEEFKTLDVARRWEALIKRNGYICDSVLATKGEGSL